jgi:hypothetical protein
MSSGKLWAMGIQEQAAREQRLKDELREKHIRLMKAKKWFSGTFGVDLSRFYKDIYTGFDLIAFDDFLQEKDEEYRKANAGELGEEVDCSISTHLANKYGEEARRMILSFI